MCLPQVGNVRDMRTSSRDISTSERVRSPLVMIRSVLLICAVLLGLFSMHVLQHAGPTPPAAPSAHQTLHGDLATSHWSVTGAGHGFEQGCAGCPMGHEMAAAACVLALLAILLIILPPRTLEIAKPQGTRFIPTLNFALDVLRNKPDLNALGICRT